MTREEFKQFEESKVITAEDLVNKEDRTLLYGYTCERECFHVYLKDMQIRTIIYKNSLGSAEMREVTVKSCWDYIPDKRVYPGESDFEFCKLLILKGCRIPFTFYEEPDYTGVFNGLILEKIAED